MIIFRNIAPKYIAFAGLFLSMVLFTSCEKESRLLSSQSGTWEIKKAEQTEMLNNETISTKSFDNAGFIQLYNNNSTLDYQNYAEYFFDSAFDCRSIKRIANNDTDKNPKKDNCFWEPGPTDSRRLTLVAESNGIDIANIAVFTVKSVSANKQEWYFIETQTDTSGDHYFKEIFFVERWNGN